MNNLPIIAVFVAVAVAFHWVVTEYDWDITEPVGFSLWAFIYLAGWWVLLGVVLGVRVKDQLARAKREPGEFFWWLCFFVLFILGIFYVLSYAFFRVELF